MQPSRPVTLQALAFLSSAAAASFGPGGCVSIHRSSSGTCVLQTKCDGRSIANFDFSFDCVISAKNITTHSLGVGSFDTEEEYDTGVQCSDCQPPSFSRTKVAKPSDSKVSKSHMFHAGRLFQLQRAEPSLIQAPASHGVHTGRMFQLKNAEPSLIQGAHKSRRFSRQGPTEVQRYGPGACVKTWRDATSGHCIMETDCPASEDLSVYEFGLLCEGQGGELVRHVFGQDSFEHHETFDTLIECEECLALDEYMDAGKSINFMAEEVESLKDGMQNVTADIAKLEAAVGGPGPAPAPAPAPAAAFVAHRRPTQAHRAKQVRAAVQHTDSAQRTAANVHGLQSAAHGHVAYRHGAKKAARQQKRLRRAQRSRSDSEADAEADADGEVDDDEEIEDAGRHEAAQVKDEDSEGERSQEEEEDDDRAQDEDEDNSPAVDDSQLDYADGDAEQ